jgi:hypothetical protein
MAPAFFSGRGEMRTAFALAFNSGKQEQYHRIVLFIARRQGQGRMILGWE